MAKKLFLSLVVCLGLVIGTNAWALDFTYTESGGEATITGYTGTAGHIVIPDTIAGFPVVSIGDRAFYNRNGLRGVIIPDCITDIGDEAFYGCADLTDMTIPDSVTSIGRFAFRLTSLTVAYFLGNAPSTGEHIFGCTPGNHDAICRAGGGCGMLPLFNLFKICYLADKLGFRVSMWEGYLAELCDCTDDSDCLGNYSCVDGQCADAAPTIGDGPFVAANSWPVLPTTPDNPMYLDQNYSALWTFSDDYASCPEFCTHTAEYKALGDISTGTELTVSTDPTEEWYAYTELPVESLENATTYALLFTITDCAGQSTTSGEHYFRVSLYDNPPVIEDGPFLAAGSWPLLPTGPSKAPALDQNQYVLWTFSDDYASCGDACKPQARYKKLYTEEWTWIDASTDPTGQAYAYTMLPIEDMTNGTYQFYFGVKDCAGQLTKTNKYYYFKVGEDSMTCNGVESTDPSVCSGNGACVEQDVCACDQNWGGQWCEEEVPEPEPEEEPEEEY